MNIDALPLAELDRLIATLVFGEPEPPPFPQHNPAHLYVIYSGRAWYCFPDYYKGDKCIWEPFQFSREDRHAIAVYQHMLAREFTAEVFGDKPDSHTVVFTKNEINYWSQAETFPLAVCRAALKAVMGAGNEE